MPICSSICSWLWKSSSFCVVCNCAMRMSTLVRKWHNPSEHVIKRLAKFSCVSRLDTSRLSYRTEEIQTKLEFSGTEEAWYAQLSEDKKDVSACSQAKSQKRDLSQ